MIKGDAVTPATFLVAATTLFTLLSAMHIIGAMTVDTLSGQGFILKSPFVAGEAGLLLVLAMQGEVGLPVMIEADPAPVRLLVAIGALFSETSLVFVIGSVTADAIGGWLLFLDRLTMTGFAAGIPVLSLEAEIRIPVMVKTAVVPAFAVVTCGAIITIASPVYVIAAVTGHTFLGSVFIVLLEVAAVAGYLFVLPQ